MDGSSLGESFTRTVTVLPTGVCRHESNAPALALTTTLLPLHHDTPRPSRR